MDNVIAFPTKSIRDRAELERAIRDGLKDNGLSQEGIEMVITNMAEFIDAINFDFTFSFPATTAIEGQFQEFSIALQERTNRLVFERVKMEVHHLIASGVI